MRLALRNLTPFEKREHLDWMRDELNLILRKRNKDGVYHETIIGVKQDAKTEYSLLEAAHLAKEDLSLAEERRKTIKSLCDHLSAFYEKHVVFHFLITAMGTVRVDEANKQLQMARFYRFNIDILLCYPLSQLQY